MIGKIIGAVVGERLSRRSGGGARGALVGALIPVIARRAFGPLDLAIAGGYAAKKIYNAQKRRPRG